MSSKHYEVEPLLAFYAIADKAGPVDVLFSEASLALSFAGRLLVYLSREMHSKLMYF